MDEDAGSRSPKTLADVSHLFFSNVEEGADEFGDESADTSVDVEHDVAESVEPCAEPIVEPDVEPGVDPAIEPNLETIGEEREDRQERTRVFVVTGGNDAPGKSTVAVNLAHALVPFGRVALFDADTRIPNARYFLGLPSWHYLSPLTGGGEGAPNVVTDAGVLVGDWSNDGRGPAEALGNGTVIFADVPDVGRAPLNFVVVDVPASHSELLSWLATRGPEYVVTARPGRGGFQNAFSALKTLRVESGAVSAGLVVNGVAEEARARDFHAKTESAARRLLSMEVRLLGAVPLEPGLGSEQRERGAVVTSRPDGAAALALRKIASEILDRDTDYGWTRG